MNEPELQLLVLDLGDSCVVKVEQGDAEAITTKICPNSSDWYGGNAMKAGENTYCFDQSFAQVREAIEQKPVPRIEADASVTLPHFHIFFDLNDAMACYPLAADALNALSQLAGKPLPVWSGGAWTDLLPKTGLGWELPIGLWRYTR